MVLVLFMIRSKTFGSGVVCSSCQPFLGGGSGVVCSLYDLFHTLVLVLFVLRVICSKALVLVLFDLLVNLS